MKIKTAMECLKCALSGFDLIISNYFHLGGGILSPQNAKKTKIECFGGPKTPTK